MKNIKLICFVLLCCSFSYSQTTEVIQINYLGQEHGLLQLNTKALALDDMGYLWVGTEDGLHRFNGYEFKSYIANPKDSISIPDDHIRGLFSVNDTLWIATNSKGIVGYKRSENRFFTFRPKSKNQDDFNVAYKILPFNTKHVLFSVKNNFVLFNRDDKSHRIYHLPEKYAENKVEDVISVGFNRYWLATSQSGLLEFNFQTHEFRQHETFKPETISCFINSKDQVYIGTNHGVYIYNKLQQTFIKSSINHDVTGGYKLNEFEYLISTTKGILKYNSVTNLYQPVVFKNSKENKHYAAVSLTEFLGDDNGNVWFGTEGEGLFHYNKFQNKFKSHSIHFPELYEDQRISIFPIYRENDSLLWLGTYAGTVKYNVLNNSYALYEKGKKGITYTFCKDATGNLWAGGITDGLMKYVDSTDSFRQWLHRENEANSLPDNEVLEIIPVSNDKLWVCTWAGGITEFDTKKETFTPVLLNNKQINRARTSLIDSNHNIWIGTDQGLYKITSANKVHHYTTNSDTNINLTNDRVFSLAEDCNGNIWIGTSSGLTFLDSSTQQTELFFKQKGFPNDFVYGLLLDDNENVWMSTNYGLSVFNPITRTFKNYTADDGLQDNEFNGKSFYKDDEGQLYFGGINGFNIINPKKIIDNPHLPNIYIESVELFNKPIALNEMFKDTLVFKSRENVLTFNFSALNYLNPAKCSYQYKLDNFDDQWSPVTKKNNVTYTNLNPGDYTLKIKASNDVGEWNPNIKSLHLIIVPPWYQTSWFKILVGMLLVLSGVWFFRFKTSKLKRDKLKLERLVASRTKDLIEKNNELKRSNITTKTQKENIEFLMKELNHRVKNNLQIISSLLSMQAQNVSDKALKDTLNIAKNRILTISYIQNDLNAQEGKIDISKFLEEFSLQVVALLSDEQSVKFKVKFNIEPNCICDLNTTLLGLIVNELITNTYKYAFTTFSESNVLEVACAKHDSSLLVSISDNGKGYQANQVRPNALGLELVRVMANQMNAELKTTLQNGVKNTIIIQCS